MQCDDRLDKATCLCCGQHAEKPGRRVTPETAEIEFQFLEKIGYSRDMLLTIHRHRVEYQLPGLIEWLEESAPN